MIDHDKEIQELEKKIEKLKREKEEKLAMPENHRLAEVLHDIQCHSNHTDGCSWDYESWNDIGYSRRSYVEKANNMLKELTIEQALNVLKFM